jgi:hypothetical protein
MQIHTWQQNTPEQLRAACCASIGFFFPQSFHLFVVSSQHSFFLSTAKAELKEKRKEKFIV